MKAPRLSFRAKCYSCRCGQLEVGEDVDYLWVNVAKDGERFHDVVLSRKDVQRLAKALTKLLEGAK